MTTNAVLSDYATLVLQYFLLTVVCQIIDVTGVAGNIINIICFIKQGFKDHVNISLLGLAVSDIGCLSTLLWLNICFTPAFRESDLPFDSVECQYLMAGVPHTVFTRVSGWITAFITMERCLCIAAPLKVKTMITPTRVRIITISIFTILIFSAAPEYVVNRLDLKFFPERNKTLIGLVYSENRESVVQVSYLVNNVFIPFSSFIVVIICSVILVFKLSSNTQWRKTSTAVQSTDNIAKRNQKVSKMIVMISAIFILCFIPVSIIFIAMSQEPEFDFGGKYRNIYILLGSLGVVLESINSSVNVLIYYYMSNKYKTVFQQLFSQCC